MAGAAPSGTALFFFFRHVFVLFFCSLWALRNSEFPVYAFRLRFGCWGRYGTPQTRRFRHFRCYRNVHCELDCAWYRTHPSASTRFSNDNSLNSRFFLVRRCSRTLELTVFLSLVSYTPILVYCRDVGVWNLIFDFTHFCGNGCSEHEAGVLL